MLTDPLSVTYNGVVRNLSRVAGIRYPGPKKVLSTTCYASSDGELELFITRTAMGDGSTRVEVILEREEIQPEGPFGYHVPVPNRVGLTFDVNTSKYNTDADLSLIQSAVLAFVTDTLRGRLIAGES